jgi:hypothetical protein
LRLTVSPRRVRLGSRVPVRLRVTAGGKPVRGAKVHLGRQVARTGANGRARIVHRFGGRPGLRHPSAQSAGRIARTTMRVLARG